jgi:hypothetical protein
VLLAPVQVWDPPDDATQPYIPDSRFQRYSSMAVKGPVDSKHSTPNVKNLIKHVENEAQTAKDC